MDKKKYRLGIDMGTASIGWAALTLNENNKPLDVLDMGVRIFDSGRNPKTYDSNSVERRNARQIRRMRDRKIARKKRLMHSLIEEGLMPQDINERKTLKSMNPYFLRNKALDNKLSPFELGRAIFHLSTRRGFKSNRCEKKSNSDNKLTHKIKILENEIKNNARTIGEFFYKRLQNGNEVRFRGSFDCYPTREEYENEFNEIKKKQSEFYPDLNWDKIHEDIFYQRPLKPQERGKCRYYPDEYRAYKDLPSSNSFRILSNINKLEYETPDGDSIKLSDNQKDILYEKLSSCESMSFDKIRELFNFDNSIKFNLEREKDNKLIGNKTSADMSKKENFGKLWYNIIEEKQDEIVESLINAQDNEKALSALKGLDLTEEQKNSIIKLDFSKNTTNLSSKFMRECSLIMREKHLNYPDAVKEMGFDHSMKEIQKRDELPYYGEILTQHVLRSHLNATDEDVITKGKQYKFGTIPNPTVHIALGQLMKVVNAIIKRYGKPEQIVIELSRDIAKSKKEKEEIEKRQKDNKENNDRIKEEIIKIKKDNESKETVSRDEILKFKLWEELGKNPLERMCPYCGKQIPASALFSKKVEIEHILPFSRTGLRKDNLTLAHTKCNLFKGTRSPYEAFASNPEGYNWEDIFNRSKNLPDAKYKKFLKDAMKDFDEESKVLDSQLNDTRYISKVTREYLTCICNDIWCVNGRNTANLRYHWGLNHLLSKNDNQKNRADHRHHAVDALVISLTDRSLIQQMAELNKETVNVEIFPNEKEFPFDEKKISSILKNMIVSHRQEHGHEGKIFEDTAMGRNYITEKIQKGNIDTIVKKPIFLTSKNITELSKEDITDNRIFNPDVRELIKKKTEDIIKDEAKKKTDLKKRLQEISKENGGLRKIKYIPRCQNCKQIKSVNNKWYEYDSINFATIWCVPEKNKKTSYKAQFISYQEAYDYKEGKISEYPKPHPAAKKIATLYKNDIVFIKPKEKDKNKDGYYALIKGFSQTDNRIDIRSIYAASRLSEWIDSTSNSISSDYEVWKDCPKGDQNYKSINTLFSENTVRPVKITADGKISRC